MPGGIELSIDNSIYLKDTIIELRRNEIADKISISRQTYSSIETKTMRVQKMIFKINGLFRRNRNDYAVFE